MLRGAWRVPAEPGEVVVDTDQADGAGGEPWSEPWSRTGRYISASGGAVGTPVATATDDRPGELPPTAPESAAPGGTAPAGPPTTTRRWRFGAGWSGGRRRLGLIAVVALAGLLVQGTVADRMAVAFAEHEMAGQIRSGALSDLPCDTTPPRVSNVHIGGFPFLTQVLTGSFQDVSLTMSGLPTPGPRVERISAQVRGVHVPIWRLATGGNGTIRIDRMRATVRMTYADLNAYLATRPGHVRVTPVDGGRQLRISATQNIPLLGAQQISGITTFSVQNNMVTLVPSQISLDGLLHFSLPLGTLGTLLPPIPIPVGDLPFDLTVTSASTDATGLSLAATASDITASTADQKPCRRT